MNSFYRQSSLYVGLTSAVLLALLVQTGQAQDLRGFVNTAEAVAGGEEIKSQENLWVLEVNYKNMRMIPVEITDPKTKIKKLELVWYFVYRVINRPVDRQGINHPAHAQGGLRERITGAFHIWHKMVEYRCLVSRGWCNYNYTRIF